jgi:hypothetical protein
MMMLKFLTDVPLLNCFIYHLELYNLVHHPDKKDCARCTVGRCKSDVKIANGTGGLSSHMRYKHRKEYDKYKDKEIEMSTLTDSEKKKKQSQLGFKPTNSVATIKKLYKAKAVFWAIEQGIPFTAFDQPSFRTMFEPFHVDASKIVTAVCEGEYRCIAKRQGCIAS